MNVVTIDGIVVGEPKHWDDASSFQLLHTISWRGKDGEWVKRRVYLDCKSAGPRSARVRPLLYDGNVVSIHGRLEQDEWDDKETGKKRRKIILQSWGEISQVCSDAAVKRAPAVGARQEESEAEDDLPF